jgi:hypothetical protein
MKKAIFCMIAIAIVGLLITSVSSVPVQKTNEQTLSLTVTALDLEPQKMSVPTQYLTQTPNDLNKMPSLGIPAFEGEGNQLHPAISLTGQIHMTAYYEEDLGNIVWTFSGTGGPPYDPGVYYDNGGDYPSIKYWGEDEDFQKHFYGTFVTSYMDLNGGPTYLFHTPDALDTTQYEMTYWDWSAHGWSDMKDADIACDNSQEKWEWGVSSYVTSSTYGNTYTDGPTVVYADETTEGQGWISWHYINGCAHTDISIDNSIIYSYAVFDWYDPDAEYWRLLCRVQDFDQIMNGYDELFDLDAGGNTEYPAVAAENGNIVIVAQTNINGNADIICLYGSSISTLSTTYVVDSVDDEMYPDIRHVSGDTFLCTYVKGNALYGKISDNAGATWGSEVMLSDPAEDVVHEYKTSDLSENAVKAMYEVDNEVDIDIYITDVISNDPPSDPTIDGPSVGSPDKMLDFILTSTDPDGHQVKFVVNWGDGNEETTALTPSGTPLTASHSWADKGDYQITVKAVDELGAESGVVIHDIVIPRGKSVNNLVLRILERYISMFPLLSQLLGL